MGYKRQAPNHSRLARLLISQVGRVRCGARRWSYGCHDQCIHEITGAGDRRNFVGGDADKWPSGRYTGTRRGDLQFVYHSGVATRSKRKEMIKWLIRG